MLSGWFFHEKLSVTVSSLAALFQLPLETLSSFLASHGIHQYVGDGGDGVIAKAVWFADALFASNILHAETCSRLQALQLLWAQIPVARDRWDKEDVECIVKQLPEGLQVTHPDVRRDMEEKMAAANKIVFEVNLELLLVAFVPPEGLIVPAGP